MAVSVMVDQKRQLKVNRVNNQFFSHSEMPENVSDTFLSADMIF